MKEIIDIHEVFARHIGTDRNLKAAAYAVSKKLEEGHICVDISEYNNELLIDKEEDHKEQNPFLDDGEMLDVSALENNSLVSIDPFLNFPFILRHGKLYLHRYFAYETDIIRGIETLGHKLSEDLTSENKKEVLKPIFEELFPVEGNSIDWQLVAAIRAIDSNFMIITGGPGTGKTTTVTKILALYFSIWPDLRVALAAPTGKAAARLNESLMRAKDRMPGIGTDISKRFEMIKASTLHRLLGVRRGSHEFRHNKNNPLDYDVIIIDESSMIDAVIMAKLLIAVSPETRLLMLGDKDQLASVEAGSIFGDLCLSQTSQVNSFEEKTMSSINSFIDNPGARISEEFKLNEKKNLLSEKIIELKKSYRFKPDRGIGKFSKELISGNLINLSTYRSGEDNEIQIVNTFDFEKVSNNKEFFCEIDRFSEYILEKDITKALLKINNTRVLCAVNEGDFGIYNFNSIIEQYLKTKKLIVPTTNFYHNQPIIVTRNDYTLGLFNGDVGIIREDEEGVLKAFFEGMDEEGNPMIRQVLPGYLAEFRTVFAMTIHKSQGSEFDSVAIVLPDEEHIPILTRELLYTAVTRAKEHALIIGRDEIIQIAAGRSVSRASGIQHRISNLIIEE